MVAIQSAESNRAVLRYIKESNWGTTPGSGTTRAMRLTSSSLGATKETAESEEIRADRMVSNIIETAASSGGEVEFEFSAGSQDDFLAAFLLGQWTKAMNFAQVKGNAVAITDTDEITVSGIDLSNLISNGQYIKLEGFLTPANNGYFKVNSISFNSGDTVITTVESTLTPEAGSAYTKILDANDVILKSTSITLEAGNVIDGGSNAFLGANLKVGQKIYIEGLGKGTGSIKCESTDPTPGDTFTISDGVDTVVFEIHNSADLVEPGNVFVPLSGTETTMAANIAAAVNDQFRRQRLRVSATVSFDTVTLTNHRGAGGSISESTDALTATNFSGGSASKHGFYTIKALPDADTIVVEETLSADANTGSATVVIKGSHLRNPGDISNITKQSFTIETGFTDVGKYLVQTGMRVGSFTLSVSSGEIVNGSFSFMGKETTPEEASVLGNTGTYTVLDTTTTEVFNATANVGSVTKNGASLATAIQSIEINGDAALREQRAIGEKFPAGIGYGRFSLTGSMTAYFENFDFYRDFMNHSTVSLGWSFTDVDHNTYFFTIPAIKITADPIYPTGIDEDVMEEMEWSAQRHPTLETMFMIDRFSSVYPMSVA